MDDSFLEMTKRLIVKKNNSGQDEKKKTLGLQKLKQTIEGGQQQAVSGSSGFCC